MWVNDNIKVHVTYIKILAWAHYFFNTWHFSVKALTCKINRDLLNKRGRHKSLKLCKIFTRSVTSYIMQKHFDSYLVTYVIANYPSDCVNFFVNCVKNKFHWVFLVISKIHKIHQNLDGERTIFFKSEKGTNVFLRWSLSSKSKQFSAFCTKLD